VSYTNIVFVKLEKRLLNDWRWFSLKEKTQLLYIKFMLLAAETYNKIPKNEGVLTQALRTTLDPIELEESIQEIKENFPKFKENKHFYYFDEFDTKTNYIPKKGNPEEIPRKSKDSLDKEEDKEIDKEKDKRIFPFKEIYNKYPKRIGEKAARKHFETTVKTDQDFKDIQAALKNYLESERVAKGFVMNASTWFNNWRDWVNFKEPFCQKCKGAGKYTSTTGYEIICDCPKGKNYKKD